MMGRKKGIVKKLACLCLMGILIMSGGCGRSAGHAPEVIPDYACIVEVTINPELRLYLSADSEVVGVEYLNQDAQDAYEALSLIGKPVDACVEEVVAAAIDHHYLESGKTVSVNVVEIKDDSVDEEALCNSCYTAVQHASGEKEVEPVIEVQDSNGTKHQADETAQQENAVGNEDAVSVKEAADNENSASVTETPEKTPETGTGNNDPETAAPEGGNTELNGTEEIGTSENEEVIPPENAQVTTVEEPVANTKLCSTCDGTGKCQECKGSGYRGAGYAVSCPRCHGSFTETCGYCDASGNSKMHEGTCDFGPCMGAHVYPCTICGGGSQAVTCQSCSGSGKCSSCGGTGQK